MAERSRTQAIAHDLQCLVRYVNTAVEVFQETEGVDEGIAGLVFHTSLEATSFVDRVNDLKRRDESGVLTRPAAQLRSDHVWASVQGLGLLETSRSEALADLTARATSLVHERNQNRGRAHDLQCLVSCFNEALEIYQDGEEQESVVFIFHTPHEANAIVGRLLDLQRRYDSVDLLSFV